MPVTLAVERNPEIAASSLELEKSRQQKIISRSLFLPSINVGAQANHYFQLNPFFGFGETTPDGKIPMADLAVRINSVRSFRRFNRCSIRRHFRLFNIPD
jgi:hypothetical protein